MGTREFNIIRQISKTIAQTPGYEECLRRVVECVADYLHVDACSILVHDDRTDRLVMEATHGLEQEAVRRIQLSVTQGVTGFCFRTGKTVNAANVRRHPHYREFSSHRAHEYRALLAVPLMVASRVIGVMDFASRDEKEFPPRMVHMAEAIASPLAVFILNARLSRTLASGEPLPKEKKLVRHALKGKPVAEGVVHGFAQFLPGAEVLDAVPPEYTTDPAAERVLLDRALAIAREEASQIQSEAAQVLAEANAAIFYAHVLLLEDPTLIQRIQGGIDRGFKLRFALKLAAEEFAREMRRVDNALIRERVADMRDVILRIHQAAEGLQTPKPTGRRRGGRGKAEEQHIIVARELLPSQLIRTPLSQLAGIVCEEGGTTTHTAILARALQIPMVVGAADATAVIQPGDELILDCSTGVCYIRPSAAVLKKFAPSLMHHRHRDRAVQAAPAVPAETRDGVAIRLASNVSLVSELPLLRQYGAMGVGLYRTEFMFMIRPASPTEDEQYTVFRRVVEAGGEFPVTVRALDVGGDKPLSYVDFGNEENPFLGWRGIRFLLSNPDMLETHFRAILRTTVHGTVHLLLPMVADLDELLAAKEILGKAQRGLDRAGVPYASNFRLGIMLEVPSAVWSLPDMLPHIDFVSIGTNDLTQYVFAVDRGNSRVTQWYRQLHPVVLRVIEQTCTLVHAIPEKTVSICGEVAGKPLAAPFLLGVGLRDLSMNPWRIPLVRGVIGKLSMAECRDLAGAATACRLDSEVVQLMREFADKHGLQEKT